MRMYNKSLVAIVCASLFSQGVRAGEARSTRTLAISHFKDNMALIQTSLKPEAAQQLKKSLQTLDAIVDGLRSVDRSTHKDILAQFEALCTKMTRITQGRSELHNWHASELRNEFIAFLNDLTDFVQANPSPADADLVINLERLATLGDIVCDHSNFRGATTFEVADHLRRTKPLLFAAGAVATVGVGIVAGRQTYKWYYGEPTLDEATKNKIEDQVALRDDLVKAVEEGGYKALVTRLKRNTSGSEKVTTLATEYDALCVAFAKAKKANSLDEMTAQFKKLQKWQKEAQAWNNNSANDSDSEEEVKGKAEQQAADQLMAAAKKAANAFDLVVDVLTAEGDACKEDLEALQAADVKDQLTNADAAELKGADKKDAAQALQKLVDAVNAVQQRIDGQYNDAFESVKNGGVISEEVANVVLVIQKAKQLDLTNCTGNKYKISFVVDSGDTSENKEFAVLTPALELFNNDSSDLTAAQRVQLFARIVTQKEIGDAQVKLEADAAGLEGDYALTEATDAKDSDVTQACNPWAGVQNTFAATKANLEELQKAVDKQAADQARDAKAITDLQAELQALRTTGNVSGSEVETLCDTPWDKTGFAAKKDELEKAIAVGKGLGAAKANKQRLEELEDFLGLPGDASQDNEAQIELRALLAAPADNLDADGYKALNAKYENALKAPAARKAADDARGDFAAQLQGAGDKLTAVIAAKALFEGDDAEATTEKITALSEADAETLKGKLEKAQKAVETAQADLQEVTEKRGELMQAVDAARQLLGNVAPADGSAETDVDFDGFEAIENEDFINDWNGEDKNAKLDAIKAVRKKIDNALTARFNEQKTEAEAIINELNAVVQGLDGESAAVVEFDANGDKPRTVADHEAYIAGLKLRRATANARKEAADKAAAAAAESVADEEAAKKLKEQQENTAVKHRLVQLNDLLAQLGENDVELTQVQADLEAYKKQLDDQITAKSTEVLEKQKEEAQEKFVVLNSLRAQLQKNALEFGNNGGRPRTAEKHKQYLAALDKGINKAKADVAAAGGGGGDADADADAEEEILDAKYVRLSCELKAAGWAVPALTGDAATQQEVELIEQRAEDLALLSAVASELKKAKSEKPNSLSRAGRKKFTEGLSDASILTGQKWRTNLKGFVGDYEGDGDLSIPNRDEALNQPEYNDFRKLLENLNPDHSLLQDENNNDDDDDDDSTDDGA